MELITSINYLIIVKSVLSHFPSLHCLKTRSYFFTTAFPYSSLRPNDSLKNNIFLPLLRLIVGPHNDSMKEPIYVLFSLGGEIKLNVLGNIVIG